MAIHVSKQVEEQLTPEEVAGKLKVNVCTVWRWIAQGKIKNVRKLGHRITRIPASEVNKFLEGQTV